VNARRRNPQEQGAALLVALVVLLLVSISLAILATALQIRMRLVRQEAEALQLGALSDAALAEALYNLTYDADWEGKDEHPFGPGGIASEVEKLGPDHYRVLATGIYAGQRRTVEAEVVRTFRGARVVRWKRKGGSNG
jgi:type II secretory pathway pseudopilin PulG